VYVVPGVTDNPDPILYPPAPPPPPIFPPPPPPPAITAYSTSLTPVGAVHDPDSLNVTTTVRVVITDVIKS
jgi:hypothetical protein